VHQKTGRQLSGPGKKKKNMEKIQTIDEQNEALRARVEREMPRPRGGFAADEEEDEFRRRVDARFLQLVARAGARDAWAARARVK
jgi:hypothetical protein